MPSPSWQQFAECREWCLSSKCREWFLSYETGKKVVYRHPVLVITSRGIKLAIVVYIFIFEILCRGRHLRIYPTEGVHRVTLQQPTKSCNPDTVRCHDNYTTFDKLPYCNQNREPYETRGGKEGKLPCNVLDRLEAFMYCEQGVMLPTRIKRFDEVRACTPNETNGWECPRLMKYSGKEREVDGHENPKYGKEYFIADIESFTFMFDHNFMVAPLGVQSDDHDMNGYWLQCPRINAPDANCTRQSLRCLYTHCPKGARTEKEASTHSNGRKIVTLPNGEVGISISKGDVFSLGTLLSLADVDLDQFDTHDSTLRSRGLTLVVTIHYDNRRPKDWLGLRVRPFVGQPQTYYTYRAYAQVGNGFKLEKTFDDPKADARTLWKYYGVRLVVKQTGQIAKFEWFEFLATLTSSLGLLAVANIITDIVLLKCLKNSDLYARHMYVKIGQHKEKVPADNAAEILINAIESHDPQAVSEHFQDCFYHLRNHGKPR